VTASMSVDIADLITAYSECATAASLVADHILSLTSIKRLLHISGVRRPHPLDQLRRQRRPRRIRSRSCPAFNARTAREEDVAPDDSPCMTMRWFAGAGGILTDLTVVPDLYRSIIGWRSSGRHDHVAAANGLRLLKIRTDARRQEVRSAQDWLRRTVPYLAEGYANLISTRAASDRRPSRQVLRSLPPS
jgi:hypothetical protein